MTALCAETVSSITGKVNVNVKGLSGRRGGEGRRRQKGGAGGGGSALPRSSPARPPPGSRPSSSAEPPWPPSSTQRPARGLRAGNSEPRGAGVETGAAACGSSRAGPGRGRAATPAARSARPRIGRTPRSSRRVAYPVGGGDADDELDGLLHVEPAVPAHHQGGLLPLRRLHGGDDTLDEILRVVGAALKHLHPLPQPARARFLVRVRLGLNRHNLHHGGDSLPGAGADSANRGAAGAVAAAALEGVLGRGRGNASSLACARPSSLKGQGTGPSLRRWSHFSEIGRAHV